MAEAHSPYYPPRSNFWRRCFAHPLARIGSELRLPRVSEYLGMPVWKVVAAFFVPGVALCWAKAKTIAWIFWPVYLGCALLSLIGLGYWVGNIALGLMVSLHATGFVMMSARLGLRDRLPLRLGLTVAVLLGLALFVYRPIGLLLSERLFMALRTPRGVVVVNCAASATKVRVNDAVAYRIDPESAAAPGVRVRAGLGLERVLGSSGDRVVFTPTDVRINGVPHPRRPDMPMAGEYFVPEKHWFIWPTVATQGAATGAVASSLLNMAFVNQSEFAGRPYQRWFGRRQPLP